MTDINLLTIENLNFSYGKNKILTNVNLSINKGDFISIIGPNGSGKSTLLKLIAGILKPNSGKIKFGKNFSEDASHYVGYVPQNFSVKEEFPISVLDVVKIGRIGYIPKFQRSQKQDLEKIKESLELMEVWHLKDKKMNELSGGQKQRVLIARALATEAKVLLFDEPSSNIDVEGQTKLYKILNQIKKELAIMVVTHDISIISNYITGILCVNEKVIYHTKNEVKNDLAKMLGEAKDKLCPYDLILQMVPYKVLESHWGDGED